MTMYEDAVAAVRAGAPADELARQIYDELTPEERLGLLDGDEEFWPGMRDMLRNGYNNVPIVHGAVPRVGIPGLRFSDGPRGVVMGHSTAFPVSMARGATWDPSLEEEVGRAIGAEVAAQGGNFFAGVCINLLRHPAWGRAQETYGDDPLVLGEFGAALTRGVRAYVMACAKHFALNSMENARFTVDVTADDDALQEVYLPHFRRVVEAGVDAIMTSYNSVNGEWAGQNPQLLTEVLRDQWGFEGVTVSDFSFGIRDASKSLEAGLDVEEPFRQVRAQYLEGDLESGKASWEWVERSGLRIIATQLRFAAGDHEPAPELDVVASPEHRALAREVAARSMVLLRNEPVEGTPVLPLDTGSLHRLAVIGRLADMPNTGDNGSSSVEAPEVVTALAGLRAALPDVEIVTVDADDPAEAARVAASADAAVVIVGYTAADEGEYVDMSQADEALLALMPPDPDPEGNTDVSVAGADAIGMGGDRVRLTLRPVDEEIILAVASANPRTIVSVISAGAVLMERWRKSVPAILMAWYSGMEGGNAVADVLIGRVDTSGRLPYAIPTSEDHLPDFDKDATKITYGRFHGQKLLDKLGVEAAFPLGYGLSYTTWEIHDLLAHRTGPESAVAEVQVTNTGARDGRHVVQVYGTNTADGERSLLGFTPVALSAGETQEVTVALSLRPLQRWDATQSALVLTPKTVPLRAGAHHDDSQAATASLDLA
ncbi:MAG: beta-glucosidase [Pauljensenia sp.]